MMAMVLLMLAAFTFSALAQQPVTIQFAYRTGDTRLAAVEKWIEEFEAIHPHIKVDYFPVASGIGEVLAINWAAGTGPDVTELWGDDAQAMARSGALLDLRPYVARDFSADDIADFWPTAWEASFLRVGDRAGVQFGIPRYMITTVHYYNNTLFEQAGAVNPSALEARGVWNWDNLREAARRLVRYDANGNAEQWGFSNHTRAWRRLVVWIEAGGGNVFHPEQPGVFTGANPESLAGIEFLHRMIWEDRSMAPQFATAGFLDGRVGIVEEGNHAVLGRFLPTIADSFDWNIAPAVVGPNGRKSYSGDDRFVVWNESAHPEEAWTFVKFLTSKRGQEIAAQFEGLAPVRRSAVPFYLELSPGLDLGVHVTNMLDASLPASSFIVGDAAQIGRLIEGALEAALWNNQTTYPLAIREVTPAIQQLMQQ